MGGMGRGGDEKDIRKKKEFGHSMAFYLFLLSLTLSLPLVRSRSLLLLHYRSHHWNSGDSTWRFLSAKASPSGQIFSLPWGHVVYRNAVKSLAWQAPYVRPQGVRGTVWSQWTCIPATWCGEGPVERANVVKADGDGDCYTV